MTTEEKIIKNKLGSSLRPLYPQIQTFFTVYPVNSLVIHFPAFSSQQDMNTLVPISHSCSCNLLDPHAQRCLPIPDRPIAIDTGTDLNHPAGPSFTDPVILSQEIDQGALLDRL